MNLELTGLDVAYGRTQVIFDVSLHIGDGELVCLMGRNGVGKSTLLNAAMGVLPLQRGQVRLDGIDLRRLPPYKRARLGIGYVPQGHQVFPQLTVRENLDVVLESNPRGSRSDLNDALDVFPALVALAGRPAGLLSGGQARQLAIARALVTRPELLILDEPTEGIQPSIILQIEDAIAQLHAAGLAVLLVEQYVEFALRLAQRYAIMEGGRIERSGNTSGVNLDDLADLLTV